MKKVRQTERGQALIEALLVLPLMMSLAGGLLYLIMFIFINTLGQHLTYETCICKMEGQSLHSCKNQVQQKLKALSPLIQKVKLSIQGSYKSYGYCHIEITSLGHKFLFQDKLTYKDLVRALR